MMPQVDLSTASIDFLRRSLAAGDATPGSLAEHALARSNGNQGRNTYLWQDAAWTRTEAERAESMPVGRRGPLWGLPVSVKDCFDLAGAPTSCGTHFYRDLHGIAAGDSWLVRRLRSAGAAIVGKTHLHPLAYGITGENPDYGDCVQPRDATALTGGSSSGAAASVQEGSAVLAIGTDTGGSVRVRRRCAVWRGTALRSASATGAGARIWRSRSTPWAFCFAISRDAPLLGGLFAPAEAAKTAGFTRFAVVEQAFLHDCDPGIAACLRETAERMRALGLRQSETDTAWWADAYDIFAPIQASEAACLHAGHFDNMERSIRERLEWGAGIGAAEMAAVRQRHEAFRRRMDNLLAEHELILLPASPLARLEAGADHSRTRGRILRYTTPFSLAGVPVVTIPCAVGGMQLAARHGFDRPLLEIAASLGEGLSSRHGGA